MAQSNTQTKKNPVSVLPEALIWEMLEFHPDFIILFQMHEHAIFSILVTQKKKKKLETTYLKAPLEREIIQNTPFFFFKCGQLKQNQWWKKKSQNSVIIILRNFFLNENNIHWKLKNKKLYFIKFMESCKQYNLFTLITKSRKLISNVNV